MARFNVFVVGFILVVVFDLVQCSITRTESNIEVLRNLSNYFSYSSESPVRKLQSLAVKSIVNGTKAYQLIRYSHGNRQKGKQDNYLHYFLCTTN